MSALKTPLQLIRLISNSPELVKTVTIFGYEVSPISAIAQLSNCENNDAVFYLNTFFLEKHIEVIKGV